MNPDYVDIDTLMEERRRAVQESIHPIDAAELKSLGEQLFPLADDPWREAYFGFLAENPGCVFHYAITHDGVHVLYCRSAEKGIWFVPEVGRGPLQERGLKILKEIVDGV
jgi:hypothetical protein